MPVAEVVVPNEDESKETSDTLNNLALAGLEPDDSALPVLNKKLGFPIRRKAATVPPDPTDSPVTARNALPSPAHVPHPSDLIADDAAPALAIALRGAHAPLREIIMTARNKEEAFENAKKFYADWKPQRVQQLLDEALQACAAAGLKNK